MQRLPNDCLVSLQWKKQNKKTNGKKRRSPAALLKLNFNGLKWTETRGENLIWDTFLILNELISDLNAFEHIFKQWHLKILTQQDTFDHYYFFFWTFSGKLSFPCSLREITPVWHSVILFHSDYHFHVTLNALNYAPPHCSPIPLF